MSQFAIERWRSTRLTTGVKPATVNRDFAALRAALTKAVDWRALKTHPMSAVKVSRVDTTGHVRYLSEDEETRLLAALAERDEQRRTERDRANEWRRARGYEEFPPFDVYTDHLHPLVLLALHTGCRRGELFDLQWRDIDLVGARVTVRAETAKSGRARVVPMNAEAVKVVRAWRPARVEAEDYVFPAANCWDMRI
jgi:integrase